MRTTFGGQHLGQALAIGDPAWVQITGVAIESVDDFEWTEHQQHYIDQHRSSEELVAANEGTPVDELVVAAVDIKPPAQVSEVADRWLIRRSRALGIDQGLAAGHQVWAGAYEDQVYPGLWSTAQALEIDGRGEVTFLGWCADEHTGLLLERFMGRIRVGEISDVAPDLTPGEVLIAMVQDPGGSVATGYRTIYDEPLPVPWEDRDPFERTMHEAPQHVLDESRTLIAFLSADESVADSSEWLLCTAHEVARTGCIGANLLRDEAFPLQVSAPADRATDLDLWLARSAPGDIEPEIETIPLGTVTIEPETSHITLRLRATTVDQLRTDPDLVELIAH